MNIELLKKAVADSRDRITISEVRESSNPLIFVNPAFERMTGYAFEEITDIDCRYLQGADRDQPAIAVIRNAIIAGEYCLVTLRNYRKDGSMFWNELSLSPIWDDAGRVTNYIGIQKNVTDRVLVDQDLLGKNQSLEEIAKKLSTLAIKDGLTGIYNRRFFDAQLDIQWKICRRNKTPLSLIIIDIDHFKLFNDSYGHVAGDTALRTVAGKLNLAFTRASDFVARYGGEEFAALSSEQTSVQAGQFADALCRRIRELQIPHLGSPSGLLIISAGYATETFEGEGTQEGLIERADSGLYIAKRAGRDRSAMAGASTARP